MNNVEEKAVYSKPMILDHRPIRFETAQSWNKGHGNRKHWGTGNGGIHYPHDPYSGPHKGEDKGKWKK